MDFYNQLGIQLVIFLQNTGNWLLPFMQFFTNLGNELFFLLVAPILYWCINKKLGLRLGTFLLISTGINSILKLAFHSPRPYWVSKQVKPYSHETSFGIPSGHSQNAAVVWGAIAVWVHKTWLWILAIFLILMIGLSRIYLGVHFPIDVLSGWLVGALLLFFLLRIEKPTLAWFSKFHPVAQILLLFLGTLIFLFIWFTIKISISGFEIPQQWIELAQQKTGSELITPLSPEGIISTMGALFGFGVGAILINALGGFQVRGNILQYLLRSLIGIFGVFVIWFGLGKVFPRNPDLLSYSLRYLRYMLITLWVTALAPLIFRLLKISTAEDFKLNQ